MADLDERQKLQELENESRFSNNDYIGTDGYQEETAAEVAPRISGYQQGTWEDSEMKTGSIGMGLMAIALSVLSLFVFPVLLGITGMVLGFIARSRGARTGTWAIAIGAISLLLGMFILPFF